MSTRLVERLEREIAQCEDPFERECLKARHAAVIARLGQLDHAKFILGGLKTQARRHGKPTLKAWVHFVDGTIHYFESLGSPEAMSGFQAAWDTARACGDAQLQALAGAWLAAARLFRGRDASVFEVLALSLPLAAADNHEALARAWLVLANLADFAGQVEDAMRCYDLVRRHAAAEGDSTTVSLMMYNRANSLISHHVRRELFGTATSSAVERVLGEIESTANLDAGLGNTALGSLAQVVRAEALTVVGRWSEAVALIDRYLDQHVKETGPQGAARFLAHRAWCHARLAQREQALADAQAVVASLVHVSDADDLAVANQRLAHVHASLGQAELGLRHADAAAAALQALATEQAALSGLLLQFRNSLREAGLPWPQD